MSHWSSLTPLQIQTWIKANAYLGIGAVEAEIDKLSDQFDGIGAPNPCLSILVTSAMHDLAGLKPPMGWTTDEISLWRALPLRLARVVSEKRAQDVRALRKCQNLEATMRQQKRQQHAA